MKKVDVRLGEKAVPGRLMVIISFKGIGDCGHKLAFDFKS